MKKQHLVEYDYFSSWKELNTSDCKLVEAAYAAAENAYAPYSKFHVGAAAQLLNEQIIVGNNQENIAYPSGLCAERVALFHIGAVFPNAEIQTLAVVAKGDLIEKDQFVTPCGSCRQVIAESQNRQEKPIRIILVAQNDAVVIFESINDLLVFPFGMKA
jgi:cytidine deaminase